MSGPSERALQVAKKETERLVAHGALAVILTGSHANGTANDYSDLDLRAIGEGPSKKLKRHDEFLVSISFMTADEHEDAFSDPEEAPSIVPGWTSAVILHDAEGHAARLKARAASWSWAEIAEKCDQWVATEMTELAEEIHTILGNLEQDKPAAAAAERSQVAMKLAQTLAVHKRIAYESENDLWDLVADAMGGDYSRLQRKALAQDEVALHESLHAALQLFALSAGETQRLLDDDQREVVTRACELAAHRFRGGRASQT